MGEVVLIYGSRNWTDPVPIRAFVAGLPLGTIVMEGGQRSWDERSKTFYGADYFANQAAIEMGLEVRTFNAEWNKHDGCRCRPGQRVCFFAGPRRNQAMADARPDRARGFRMPGKSSGTDDMTRRLVAAGIPHEVTTP